MSKVDMKIKMGKIVGKKTGAGAKSNAPKNDLGDAKKTKKPAKACSLYARA